MTNRSGIRGGLRSLTASLGSLALAATCLITVAPSAVAATAEAPPETVTADALPTWQINGVVYSQAIVGSTVYVTGSFTKARPPGVAAGGAGEVTANNIFAYNLVTGNRVASFNHSLNGQGLVIRQSPDGSRIYVGGDFTTVDGIARGHVAAFDTGTNALVSNWAPSVSGQVRGFGVTASTVFVGGNFMSANGAARTRLAAFQTSNGTMTSWAPSATGGYVWAMTMSPGDSKVLVGGSFTQLSSTDAYGMGAIQTSTGATLPWQATSKIRTAGSNGAITALKTDGTLVYGSGYAFGAGASFEGTFGLSPDSGSIVWVNDCLGDTYDVATQGQVLYAVSHYHDCSAVDAFPDTNPRSRWMKATAQYSTATNITTRNDAYGWDFRGYPYAQMLDWWPELAFGSYTSAGQAAWAVDTAGDYVVLGGEFPRVNGVAQQGLTRMVKGSAAPKSRGPRYTTIPATPIPETTAVSLQAGTARVSWGSAWDQDDTNLTYEVLRDGNKWVHSVTSPSNFWTLPRLGFVDKGLEPGSTHTYQVRISDGDGNLQWSPKSNVVTVGTGTSSGYADLVTSDGAAHLWRLGEPSGSSGMDWAGFDDVTFSGGYTRAVAGAIQGDPDTASRFNGSSGFAVSSTPVAGPNVFSAEAWFRTTSKSGGKIVGFGDRKTGTSSNYDRHIYMDAQGKVWFGVWNSGSYTVNTTQSLNDGQWHHVVGTMDGSGVTLYVDGKRIGKNTGTSVAQPYSGYWRIGGDTSWSGNAYFNGDIDEVAIYPDVLPLLRVQDHYRASGRALNVPTRPSDPYGKAVWDAAPDLYWRLGESSGNTAADSSPNTFPGTYTNTGVTRAVKGAVAGTSNTAVTLDGVRGGVSSAARVSNPTVYSQELWFRTNTNRGGKLIGLGNLQTGNSSNYDRHVYMLDNGTLRFGTYTGVMNVIDSADPFNDGAWHHLVATQGVDGMKLWVDGILRGTNPQTQAQAYDGYWRVGGDTAWGGNSSDWFAGSIDEVAVYPSVLTQQEIQEHFQAGGGALQNQPPSASFTHAKNGLSVSVDGSGSSDPDGTIAAYSWSWGDSSSNGSGTTASHTYSAAGTYSIQLTVTDDDGAKATTSQEVTVAPPPPNSNPNASFTRDVSFLRLSVDGSSSSDPDGSIVGYSWNWGDSSANGSGATATHTYATAGTYTVALTVTDDKGATGSVSHEVTVASRPNQPPTATFTQTTSGLTVSVDGRGSSDPDGAIASYAWNWGDSRPDSSGATATHTYAAAGTYTVQLTVTDDAGATDTISRAVTVTAETVFARDDFGRSRTNGWGAADVGGTWTQGGPAARWSVSNGLGRVSLNAGDGYTAYLSGTAGLDTEVSMVLSTDRTPTGGGQYFEVISRRVASNTDYRAKLRLNADGTVALYLTRLLSNNETVMAWTTVPGLTYASDDRLEIRLQTTGTSPTTVRAKVWRAGTPEPTKWALSSTDSTVALQTAGSVGLYPYVSGSSTNGPVSYSIARFWAGSPRP